MRQDLFNAIADQDLLESFAKRTLTNVSVTPVKIMAYAKIEKIRTSAFVSLDLKVDTIILFYIGTFV